MKKVLLALIALAFAFAVSSCCDQAHCPGNMRCNGQQQQQQNGGYGQETPYRWDNSQQNQQGQERQNRRW